MWRKSHFFEALSNLMRRIFFFERKLWVCVKIAALFNDPAFVLFCDISKVHGVFLSVLMDINTKLLFAITSLECYDKVINHYKNKQDKTQQGDRKMEFWDIYDKDKKPTGRTMKRNDWCLKDGEYHLTVLGVVARPDGTFLITKRVMTKAWAPGCWEVSGGAAQAGEESREAVLREVKEETGLDAGNAEGGYLFTYKRENPGEGDNYFVDVYRFVMDIDDKDLKLQTEETDGYMFATLEQIQAFAAEDKFLHYESIKRAFEFE